MASSMLTGLVPSVSYAENSVNDGVGLLFRNVTLTDPEGFSGGALRVTGLLVEDRVSVLDRGAGPGAIGLAGVDVTWGGALIGTLSGGVGAELRIDLGAGATAAAVEALIDNITYANASDSPIADRTLRLHLADASGAAPDRFTEMVGGASPLGAIDIGYGSMPAFVDLDGDGDLDAVVGQYSSGALRLFGHEQSGLQVTLSLVEDNILPTAQDDAFATSERTAISGSVLANNGAGADFDSDGGTLSVKAINGAAASVGAAITLASGALLTLRADGTFDYDPTGAFGALMTGENAADSFAYTIEDGQGGEDTATAGIAISGVTHTPIAQFDLLSTTQDAAITGSVFANNGFGADVDLDGDVLTVVRLNNAAASVGQPMTLTSGAQLTLNADGTLEYDPMGAFDWLPGRARVSDSFSYVMTDGQQFADISAVILINGVNDAPEIASPAAFTAAPGDTAVGAIVATDAEGDAISYAIAGGADAGLFAIDAGSGALSFTAPPAGGDYEVIVAASDGAASTQQAVAVTVPPAGAAIGEVMQLTVNSTWQTLNFANTYVDPVVFALAPTLNEADAAATRFKNISGTSAEIRLQENKTAWDAALGEFGRNSGEHGDEAITFLVMERGVHTLEDGTVIQVAEISTNKHYVKGFESIAFDQTLDTTPSIFSQVQTVNGSDFIISRQRNPDGSGFQLTMQEEQADNINHAHEDVGWMAFSQAGTIYEAPAAPVPALLSAGPAQVVAMTGAAQASDVVVTVSFGAQFEHPVVIASLSSMTGGAAAIARVFNVTEAGSWQLADGTVLQAGLTDLGATARNGFAAVAFDTGFAAGPAVLSQTQTAHDGAFVKTRMQGVDRDGFGIALEESEAASWGAHGVETVGWVAVDMGLASDADGFVFEAGGMSANHRAAAAEFEGAFDAAPGMIAGLASFNAPDAGAAGLDRITATGFDARVQKDQSRDAETGHGVEAIHWIAFADGDILGDAII